MVKKIGSCKKHSPVNPKGKSSAGGEYQSDMLQISGKSTKAATLNHKSAMIDGPYGGKKKQS